MNIFQQKRLFKLFNDGHKIILSTIYLDGFIQEMYLVDDNYMVSSEVLAEQSLEHVNSYRIGIYKELDSQALLGK